jgi:hypothetical protein
MAAGAFAALRFFYPMGVVSATQAADTTGVAAHNNHIVDSAVSMIRSGYIVVRTGLGADSYLLSQMNLVDKTYSHCGIVMMEQGYPFVYHCIGGEDNPNAKMRRDSASFFFSPLHNFGFGIIKYDYTDDKIMELYKVVRKYYGEKRMFDMKFDLQTDDRLYCAEMIYKAVNAATNDILYIKPSSAFGYRFVGIDDLYRNKHATQVWQVKFK